MNDFDKAFEKLVKHLAADYKAWGHGEPEGDTYTYEKGRKYTRIVANRHGSRSVWGFVENATGNLYKAATWKAPALNHVRANIYSEPTWVNCKWTGLAYMDSLVVVTPLSIVKDRLKKNK